MVARPRARDKGGGTIPFPFLCTPFALLARPESPSHFLLNARTLPSPLVNLNFRHFNSLQAEYYYGYAILMSPSEGEMLSMTATAWVIWLRACVRYWQEPITGTGHAVCAPCFKLVS